MTVQDLLTDESKWVKYHLAKNENGFPVEPHMPDAVSFCLLGAVMKVHDSRMYLQEKYHPSEIAVQKICVSIKELYPDFDPPTLVSEGKIAHFNNRSKTTFQDIRKVIEHANV